MSYFLLLRSGFVTAILWLSTGLPLLSAGSEAVPAVLPDSQVIKQGETAALALSSGPDAGASYQWHRDGRLLLGQTNWYLLLPQATEAEQGSYVVRVQSGLEPPTNMGPAVVRVMPVPPGTLDARYNAGLGAEAAVWSLATSGEGEVLVGGAFRSFARPEGANLVRFHANGRADDTFSAGFLEQDGGVFAVQAQSDGRMLVGGSFSICQGQQVGGIVRLLADGTLDPTFRAAPGVSGVGEHSLPVPPSPGVFALVTLPDGRSRIGGLFTNVHGLRRLGIAGLRSNGEVDDAFDPGEGFSNAGESQPAVVYTLALASSNLTLAAGDFTTFDGRPAGRLVALDESGHRASSFGGGAGFDSVVNILALQRDGRILAGGRFRSYDGVRRVGLARLQPDGRLDGSFDAGPELTSVSGEAEIFALQPLDDGKLILAGRFDRIGGVSLANLARLLADGSVDRGFGTAPLAWSGAVYAVRDRGSAGLMVGGQFSFIDPPGLAGLAHLLAGREIPAPRLGLERTWDNQLKLVVSTLPDVIYWLQSRPGVAAGDWQTSSALAGDGSVQQWMRSIDSGGSRFHRVVTKHAQPPMAAPASLRDRALLLTADARPASGPILEPFAVHCGDVTFGLSKNGPDPGEQGTYAYTVIGSREAVLSLTSTNGSAEGLERRLAFYMLTANRALFRYEYVRDGVQVAAGFGLADLRPSVLPGPRLLQPRLGPDCLEWSLQISGVDLSQAVREGQLVSDPVALVFRETGSVRAAGLSLEYSLEAVLFDEAGCPSEIVVTASGELLSPSPQTVRVVREP